jgi:hypothetical protein
MAATTVKVRYIGTKPAFQGVVLRVPAKDAMTRIASGEWEYAA